MNIGDWNHCAICGLTIVVVGIDNGAVWGHVSGSTFPVKWLDHFATPLDMSN